MVKPVDGVMHDGFSNSFIENRIDLLNIPLARFLIN